MKIIIPMAGLGSRFQNASDNNPEYKKPKPFISVKGTPMVTWATRSLPFFRPQDAVFVILKEHDAAHNISDGLRELYGANTTIVSLDQVTRGPAETVYKAKNFIDPEEDLLITDSDHHFDGSTLAELINNRDEETAGIVPVFTARNEGIPKWSYSLTSPDSNLILKVGEKDRSLMERGAYANIGAYYFSKGKFFLEEIEKMIVEDCRYGEVGKAEFYVAPIYQRLIERGLKIKAAIVPTVWGLGTPSDLEYFLQETNDDTPSFQK